jgi:hypothetical protein
MMLGKGRIYTWIRRRKAYADDVILLAENEEEMTSTIENFERYLDRKKLEMKGKGN